MLARVSSRYSKPMFKSVAVKFNVQPNQKHFLTGSSLFKRYIHSTQTQNVSTVNVNNEQLHKPSIELKNNKESDKTVICDGYSCDSDLISDKSANMICATGVSFFSYGSGGLIRSAMFDETITQPEFLVDIVFQYPNSFALSTMGIGSIIGYYTIVKRGKKWVLIPFYAMFHILFFCL